MHMNVVNLLTCSSDKPMINTSQSLVMESSVLSAGIITDEPTLDEKRQANQPGSHSTFPLEVQFDSIGPSGSPPSRCIWMFLLSLTGCSSDKPMINTSQSLVMESSVLSAGIITDVPVPAG
jgi:uncharacterized protein YcfL